MAYTTFPAYAQFLLDDYQLAAGGGIERTDMDDGFIAQTPIQSLARYEVTLTYRLRSREDMDAFERWRSIDLVLGARYFAWPDVYDTTGTTMRRARIVNGAVTYKALNSLLEDYSVSFTLEYWR